MKIRLDWSMGAAALVVAMASGQALAANVEQDDIHETVTPTLAQILPNVPGKSMKVVTVDYPPGAKSLPHTHGKSAFIYAYVVSGAIRSQVNDEPVRTYQTGEGWVEAPGAHHTVSENASASTPARLLAVFVIDTGDTLTSVDKR